MLRRFLLEGRAFILKFARTSIGALNEHFLHHRRHSRSTRDCGLPRTACLNKRTIRLSSCGPFNRCLTVFVTSAVNLMKRGTLRDYTSQLIAALQP
jgi:hypothetical protein